jgi:3-oxoacyl-[acyl-carrier-protein] synthase-3
MAKLSCIEYFLPEGVLTNQTISEQHPEWAIEKISDKTGINTRHIAARDEFASDLALKAAEKLFATSHFDRSKVDFLLYCTQSPDYFLPTTACILQEKLQLNEAIGALDFNLGCSGYIYGLGLAKGLVASGQASNVLFITSETYSKFIHPDDKSNKTLFGDGAAATIVSADEASSLSGDIGKFVYGTSGKGYDKLIVRNGGIRNKACISTPVYTDSVFDHDDSHLYMDGAGIFNFTAFEVPKLIQKILATENITKDEVDLFVFHQANKYMLETVRKRCQIPAEKFYVNIAEVGNTVSSTIPIALKLAMEEEKIKPGMKVMLVGFGVGLSMGATLIRF